MVFPLVEQGDVEIPKEIIFNYDYMSFDTVDEIVKFVAKSAFDDVADRHCCIQDRKTLKYIVFFKDEAIPKFLETMNEEHRYLQMFGKYMIPSFDVDVELRGATGKELEDESLRSLNYDTLLSKLATMLNVQASQFDVVDRSREDKISFHIRLPGYVIDRTDLKLLVTQIKMTNSCEK